MNVPPTPETGTPYTISGSCKPPHHERGCGAQCVGQSAGGENEVAASITRALRGVANARPGPAIVAAVVTNGCPSSATDAHRYLDDYCARTWEAPVNSGKPSVSNVARC